MKFLLLVLLLQLNISSLYPQEARTNQQSLAFNWGISSFRQLNHTFSDRVYKGTSLMNFKVFFNRSSGKNRHEFSMDFKMKPAFSQDNFTYISWTSGSLRSIDRSLFQQYDLSYTYYKKLGFSNSVYLGGVINWQTNIFKYQYAFSDHTGYFVCFSVSPTVRKSFHFSRKSSFNVITSFALVSWVSRTPFAVIDDNQMVLDLNKNKASAYLNWISKGSLFFLSSTQILNTSVHYSYGISAKVRFQLAYRFQLLKHNAPEQLVGVNNEILIGISLQL